MTFLDDLPRDIGNQRIEGDEEKLRRLAHSPSTIEAIRLFGNLTG
jgi:hypothetical protein